MYIPLSALPLLPVHLHAIPLSIPPLRVTVPPTSRPTVTQNQPLAHQVTEGLGTYYYTEARKGGPFRSMVSRVRQATGSWEAPNLVVRVLNEDQASPLLHMCMHLVPAHVLSLVGGHSLGYPMDLRQLTVLVFQWSPCLHWVSQFFSQLCSKTPQNLFNVWE